MTARLTPGRSVMDVEAEKRGVRAAARATASGSRKPHATRPSTGSMRSAPRSR